MKKLFYEYGSRNQREVDLMSKNEIEKIIDDLDVVETYKIAYEEANGYSFSGTAYACLDVSDGEIYTKWLQQNNFTINNFTEVILLRMDTPIDLIGDINDILNDEEIEEYNNSEFYSCEEFVIDKFGEDELEERKINIIEYWASETGLKWDNIQDQIDEIYEDAIEDDEEF